MDASNSWEEDPESEDFDDWSSLKLRRARKPQVSDVLVHSLVDSVTQGNMEQLHAILAQKKKDKDTIETIDKAIGKAMDEAAITGNLEACQALYSKLSDGQKRGYAKAVNICGWSSPLHWAASQCKKEVARFLIHDCRYNINQIDSELIGYGAEPTPLLCAMRTVCDDDDCLDMTRFLLENGADPEHGLLYDHCPLFHAVRGNSAEMVHLLLEYKANPNLTPISASLDEPDPASYTYMPLFYAVQRNMAKIVCLLLEHGADPNLNRINQCANNPDWYDRHVDPVVIDMAIMNANVEILDMVLEYGALTAATRVKDAGPMEMPTALNDLFEDTRKSLETKLEICRMLLKHSKKSKDMEDFLEASLEAALRRSRGVDILFQAGMNPPLLTMYRAIQDGRVDSCELLIRYGVDIFLEDNNDNEEYATTPFHAAAREKKTDILDLFLQHWDERFAANGGKNDDGDYPLHVLCCDSNVSLQAIKLVVERQAQALTTTDGEQGLFPFHFAAMWKTKVDVIYHLLRHCPDALGRLPRAMSSANGNHTAGNTPPLAAAPCDGNGKPNGRNQVQECGPVKKKVKVT